MSRIKTTGIVEMHFTIKEVGNIQTVFINSIDLTINNMSINNKHVIFTAFRVFDVGGQRSERKKW